MLRANTPSRGGYSAKEIMELNTKKRKAAELEKQELRKKIKFREQKLAQKDKALAQKDAEIAELKALLGKGKPSPKGSYSTEETIKLNIQKHKSTDPEKQT